MRKATQRLIAGALAVAAAIASPHTLLAKLGPLFTFFSRKK